MAELHQLHANTSVLTNPGEVSELVSSLIALTRAAPMHALPNRAVAG